MKITDVLGVENATVAAAVNGADDEVTIVPAQPGKRICVVAYVLTLSDTGAVQWTDGIETLSGPLSLGQSGVIAAAPNPDGYFSTGVGEELRLYVYSTTALNVGGHVNYVVR